MSHPRTPDAADALRARFRGSTAALPTGSLSRLWKTGVSAASLGAAVLGGRLRGSVGEQAPAGVGAADLASIVALAARLGELKGVAMKVGQIMGYVDVTLPAELRDVLSVLQTAAPATPFAAVEATVRDALGDRAEALLRAMERAPVSVASIGQVHRARLPDGAEVAVKVRHPGIAEAMAADFSAAGAGASFARMLVPGAGGSIDAVVGEARAALVEECDLGLEAARQGAFAARYAGDPDIVVPTVRRELCSASVLVTAWTPGRPLADFVAAGPSQAERDRVGRALFRFYLGGLYRDGVFHADPHPGNLAVGADGRLVVYDFGCVRTFSRGTVRALAALADAVRADSAPAIAEALRSLGAAVPDDPAALAAVRPLLRGFFAPVLEPGARRVSAGDGFDAAGLVADKRTLLGLRLPGELLFLFRLRFGLYAVLASLGAVADWSALERGYAREA